ncbi:PH domain-containing protein [Spirilliplanes yamanashiensis]|uniref:Low molecular weight protein antigen 6 PH domain-containing protein n=1 Tax=Spirilliplanes yamanashiensis TaxID=42233 RepID=A0A8J3Y8W7_9ACTN|nr:PH domain-containing protein [Spirilliplanes yamanashiensis]MDP9815409.1 hypothetical protein [Spirilliplanes yamanashiensis]GIJ03664.1 hypothetical protein Sya03_30160 [Spirilliplanes yamanashiensis]
MSPAWTRPYTPGTGRWIVIGWEAVSLAALAWTTADMFGLVGTGLTVLAAALAAVWVVGSWRIVEMGVYVSDHGVRIRGLLRTRTLAWSDIQHIWLHRAEHRLGPIRIPSGLTVLIERRDGRTVNTELWAQGVDFHSRPSVFKAVYHELRTRHVTATQPA